MKLGSNLLIVAGLLTSIEAYSADVKIKGDLRFRHEKKDAEGKESRSRQRIRARLGASSQVNENLKIGFRIATGGDATSRNQSFDDGFSPKGFNLDLAYFDYKRNAINFTGGKIKNPFFLAGKSQLVWDSDVTLEGANLKYSGKAGTVDYFAQAGEFWYDERSGDTSDGILYAGQLGLAYKTDSIVVKFGAAVYNFNHIKGEALIAGEDGGNSVDTVQDTDGNVISSSYANKYIIQDIGLEVGLPNVGLTVFANTISNTEADEDGAGLYAGATYKKGKLKVTVATARLEKDATVGALSDGDFGGGGTDRIGERIILGYKIDDNTSAGITHRIEKLAVEEGADFQMTQVDLKFKF